MALHGRVRDRSRRPLRRADGARRDARLRRRLVKTDDKTASVTARRGRQQQASSIVKLWTSSPTIAPIAGTRWAAYNAVTEYLDHFQPVRGARTSRAAADTRALRAVTPGSGVETLKLDAFRLLQTT
jgi:hypothetical protein